MPARHRPKLDDGQLTALVRAACTYDDDAWTRLIAQFDHLVRGTARSYRLQPGDVDDVVQITWMRLYEHVGRLRDPLAVGGWLVKTAQREAMRVLQRHVREELSDDPQLGIAPDCDRPEAVLLAGEERVLLEQAIAVLPSRQRTLITLLAAQPDADYKHISATLQMPQGSIGPTRARGLVNLSRDPMLCRHHLTAA